MIAAVAAPGLYFEAARPPPAPSPLRTDVAGFAGRTRRGPLGAATRVTGWREYLQLFGGLRADADTPLAIQGYFDNGGDAAWIVRLPAGRPPTEAGSTAGALWDLTREGPSAPPWEGWSPEDAGFTATRFRAEASSPGAWGRGVKVDARYRSHGVRGQAEVDLIIRAVDEPEERLIGLPPGSLEAAVAVASNLIRLVPEDPFAPRPPAGAGPQLLSWRTLTLTGGDEHVTAAALWDLTREGPSAPPWVGWSPADAGFAATRFRIEASSPAARGGGVKVDASYRSHGGQSEVDLIIRAGDEPEERLTGLPPGSLEAAVAAASNLIRLVPEVGPQLLRWRTLTLGGGDEHVPEITDYTAALAALGDQDEVALSAFPDLHADLHGQALDLQLAAMAQADSLHDRLVLLDLPAVPDVAAVLQWSSLVRGAAGQPGARAGAAYHPSVSVLDPLGGVAQPLRTIAPSGHVAGLISAMDRSRGAQYTPANATLAGVADVQSGYDLAGRAALNAAGVNLLLCKPGQGVQVWGGRTLLDKPQGRYVAHRRLIHRLVRAARRVAAPLVFETNGPALWLSLVRGVTTVLLEAWWAGGLQGARAEEAFQVVCDATNNPPAQQDLGIVVCDVALAPATPMEFITLRISLSAQGSLDVFES